MTIFFLKSLLSMVLLALTGISLYTMFEVFGRSKAAEAVARFKRFHKIAGYAYLALFFLIAYLCVGFVVASKADPSPRASLHILLALAIIVLFAVKVLYVRVYRQFYLQAKTIGTVMGIMSIVLVGISGGYYFAESGLGRDQTVDKSVYYALQGPFLTVKQTGTPGALAIRTDPQSIGRGRILFNTKCSPCHDPNSTRTIVGPGLKGLLKNPVLPISKHPATAESIRFQLRQPMGRMPSFAYLSEDEIDDLIAYLNTL
jgi:hypothetical protein